MKLAALAVLAGCNYITDGFESNGFSGDQYPIIVDTSSGAIVVGMEPTGESPRTAVLDVMSPLVTIDRGADAPPTETYPDLTLLGAAAPGAALDVPRAKFGALQTIALHPCDADTCNVGTPAAPVEIDSIFGMPAFGSDALRLHLDPAAPQMFVLPDIAGDEASHSLECDAVFPGPFRGGGTLLIGGTEIPFSNWRIAIDTCVAPDPDPHANITQAKRGTDMLLVASTGLGVSILGESAYARYQLMVADQTIAPDVATLPVDSVYLPSGPVIGHRSLPIASVALVANDSADARAPCRQVFASHKLALGDCTQDDLASPDVSDKCPCPIGQTFCGVPAVVEVAPAAGVSFLIVPDDEATLQALRAELRADRPEVDGILGADVLANVEVDVDYPHRRLLARCWQDATCSARPELNRSNRIGVQHCF